MFPRKRLTRKLLLLSNLPVPRKLQRVCKRTGETSEILSWTILEFKVIGAGTDNKSPVKGAVRWIPLYWSMSSVGDRYNSVWKIGSPVGISTGASYTMYIFFKQQVYNGKLWD